MGSNWPENAYTIGRTMAPFFTLKTYSQRTKIEMWPPFLSIRAFFATIVPALFSQFAGDACFFGGKDNRDNGLYTYNISTPPSQFVSPLSFPKAPQICIHARVFIVGPPWTILRPSSEGLLGHFHVLESLSSSKVHMCHS